MLFKIVEHIDTYERTISIQPINECLICFEINTPDKLTPIDLKTQQMYLKMCNCGGWFHITCLCQWYEASNSCPICRVDMKKRETILSKCFFYANNIGWNILISDPERFKQFNPENGWGDYEGLCNFVYKYRNACWDNPDAELRISR